MRATAAATGHQHEAWMLRDSAAGGRYCAACGDRVSIPVPELVAKYRARIAADPGAYDDPGDLILWLIRDTDDRTWSPSELARAVGCTTQQARDEVCELVKLCLINTDGRGAVSRYWNLRG